MELLPSPTRALEEQITALREGAGALETDERVLAIRGTDRASWLSGMVTNETSSLAPGQSRYAAMVQVKGKIMTDVWIHARADEILLAVPSSVPSALVTHLEKFIIMEDVEVVLLEGTRVLTVQGPNASTRVPPDGLAVFACDRLGRGGINCVVTQTPHAAITEAVERGQIVTVTEQAWDTARLEAGVPRFGVDFDGDHYVQEANITARAVSFQKGCYVGQEVVCRLEMRGHVRRQLVSLVLEGEPPARGTKVDGVGTVTSSAYSPKLGRAVALAMVKWDTATTKSTVDVGGRSAQILARPVP